MKDQEIFDGFNISIIKKAKGGESYFAAEEMVLKSVKNPTKSLQDVEKRGEAYYENIIETTHSVFRDLVGCIEKMLAPSSVEVQSIIKKHSAFAEQINRVTKETYKAMAQLYKEHPEYRKQLDPFHPQLAEFMAEAMSIFANSELA